MFPPTQLAQVFYNQFVPAETPGGAENP